MNKKPNGCGGAGSRFKPPYHLFFRASCNKHDEGYLKGGDEDDRWYADNRFWLEMRIDVRKKMRRSFTRWYYFIWCRLYYLSVRWFGSKYFNYKKQ